MTADRPPRGRLWHLALNVTDLAAMERFYVDLLGFDVEWRPDPENVYLTSGHDNLALHVVGRAGQGALAHLGLCVATPADVDAWATYLASHGFAPQAPPRTHRDGARSFYVADPEGNALQIICHPPLAKLF